VLFEATNVGIIYELSAIVRQKVKNVFGSDYH